jgi:hypothetical protein
MLQDLEKKLPFANAVKNRIDKGIVQWKKELTKDGYELFYLALCHSIARAIENIVFSKKFQQLGAILLDKVGTCITQADNCRKSEL